GFPQEVWLSYCEERGEAAYEDCTPLPGVSEYLWKLKWEGARLFVLTSSTLEIETRAKKVFVDKHFPGLFDEVYAVEHDAEKVPFIVEMAEKEEIPLAECLLLEDTYNTVLAAHERGIAGVHISNVLAGNVTY
ncbi:MAG: HAD hydrolase-like protein, partial [Blautia sp.]|nr:HAD hydrolase-like protein [Blautia sp.]